MNLSVNTAFILSIFVAALAALGVWILQPAVGGIEFLPDQGFNWYYWKLPDPTLWTRATSWGGYALHQAFIWGCLIWAQRNRDELRNRKIIHPINVVILCGTLAFVGLHYLQTYFFFDGLGQDVDVIWSQGSVVIMLAVIVLLEAPRRGFFFGIGRAWFRNAFPLLVKSHGYYFSWALVFTFWYHPMYTTWGHVTGFFYMFLLFIQIGFIFTTLHNNRYWTALLEITVVLHAVVMASINAPEAMPMFGFGFLAMFMMCYMYGLGWSKTMLAVAWAVFLAAVAYVYSDRGWDKIDEVIRIPVILFAFAAVLGGIFLAISWLRKRHA